MPPDSVLLAFTGQGTAVGVGDGEPFPAPAYPEGKRVRVEQPDVTSYSIAARVWLGIAIIATALLATMLTTRRVTASH